MTRGTIEAFNASIQALDAPKAKAITEMLGGLSDAPSLGIHCGPDKSWSYLPGDKAIEVRAGVDHTDVVLEIDERNWSRLAHRTRTIPGLFYEAFARVAVGNYGDLMKWEVIFDHILFGDPLYTVEQSSTFTDRIRKGEANQAFTMEDAEEAAKFMADWGVARIKSVFSAEEIEVIRNDIKAVAATIEKDDPQVWWTEEEGEEPQLARINYLGERCDSIRSLHDHPGLKRIIEATGLDVVPMTNRMDAQFAVLKTAKGEANTLANLPWHKDCGLGMHHFICPSCIIGIQLTPANKVSGQLQILAGSHRYANNPTTIEQLGDAAPIIGVETQVGDITIHSSHVLHCAPPSLDPSVGRETLYIQFYPPALKQHIAVGEGVNDLITKHDDGSTVKAIGSVTR